MWGNDETIVVRKLLVKLHQQFLVGWPGTSSNTALSTTDELLHFGERLGLPSNGCHAVEARVATHGDVCHAVGLEPLSRGVVLHEKMRDAFKLAEEPSAIPTEKIGIWLQDERDVEQGNASPFQSPNIVEPKLVFDEECRHEMMALHPLHGMGGRVGRQVEHLVGQGIVLANLVTRWREK